MSQRFSVLPDRGQGYPLHVGTKLRFRRRGPDRQNSPENFHRHSTFYQGRSEQGTTDAGLFATHRLTAVRVVSELGKLRYCNRGCMLGGRPEDYIHEDPKTVCLTRGRIYI